MSTQTTPNRIFLIYLLLTFYCTGAAMMNEFVVYPGWAEAGKYISAADFARWHTRISTNTALTLVAPMLLLTPVILLLFWYRPAAIPRWCLFVVLLCHAAAWLCTTLVQLPVELQFDHGRFSAALMGYLRHVSWIRTTAFVAETGVAAYMASQFFTLPAKKERVAPVQKPNIPFTVVRGRLTRTEEARVK